MIRRVVVIFSALFFSGFVLSFTLLNVASIKYNFSSSSFPVSAAEVEAKVEIDYTLPYPGGILPDSPLWYLKALRDKALIFFAGNSLNRAEVELLCSDKRIQASEILFQRGKSNLALSTLMKGEKYLQSAMEDEEKARGNGVDTSAFLTTLAKASLKHREVSEEILSIAPEDIKPKIVQTEDYSKNVYKESRDVLLSKSLPVPKSPFKGD